MIIAIILVRFLSRHPDLHPALPGPERSQLAPSELGHRGLVEVAPVSLHAHLHVLRAVHTLPSEDAQLSDGRDYGV